MAKPIELPDGIRGRALALGILLLALGLAWFGCLTPPLAWYASRAEDLDRERDFLRHSQAIAARLPELERERASAAETGRIPAGALLDAPSDSLAGATLQQKLEGMAGAASVTFSSVENVTPTVAGRFRKVGLRVAMSAPWPALVAFLSAIESAQPEMVVNDIEIHSAALMLHGTELPLDVALTVFAFRAPSGGEEKPPS